MTEGIIRVVLVVLGLGTASPVIALVAPGTLESSYGVDNPEPMVLVLLQHRGSLQAALGAALVWSAFRPSVRVPVAIAAIFTKGTGFALTVPDTMLRETLSTTTFIFDSAALILLALIAVWEAGRSGEGVSGVARAYRHTMSRRVLNRVVRLLVLDIRPLLFPEPQRSRRPLVALCDTPHVPGRS